MKVLLNCLLALTVAAGSTAAAQGYPGSKPIRYVVGFPAGSSIDVVSRIVLDDIHTRTNATIVIENRPGALGALGIEAVQRAEADGYTLTPSSSATHSSGPHLSNALKKLDPVQSLSRVARLVRFDVAVVTRASGPYKDAKALIDTAKAKPDELTYGFGSGTGQVGSAAFSHAAGIKVRGIPYKGQPAALTDLLGGQVDFVSSDLGAILSFLRQGSLAAVAVLSDKRSPFLPDTPTAREAGLPEVALGGWIGIDGPAKLPADITAWWEQQVSLSLQNPAVVAKLGAIGIEAAPLGGAAFGRFVTAEQERWGSAVRQAGIQPE
jgi:tripartite-type tricarboxylate transporter receptor subunit TctC